MQSDKNTSFQTLLRVRVLKSRAKQQLLKTNEPSMKAYIPLNFSNFLRISYKDLKHYSMRDTHQRGRKLKSRAKQQLLKSHMFSTKAYIPVTFSNFLLIYPLIFRIFSVSPMRATWAQPGSLALKTRSLTKAMLIFQI
jgi:hypothetical protein